MSSEVYVYTISRADAEKDKYISPGLTGEGIDDLHVTLGEDEGFELLWISPNSGDMMEGLQAHLPLVWSTTASYMVSKEQILLLLDTCRRVAKRDGHKFHGQDGANYLIKEFNDFEAVLNEMDLTDTVLFMHEH